ncbi:MAG: alpha-glucosidase [Candidatus Lokiarchaeota archaeon]|nr:alpha-glucosidase [Candidatus Lokiarchaeota archaeon]
MLNFEQLDDGFKLKFKDYLFLTHTQDAPCFKLGKGTARYKEHHGHFKIREKELVEIPLKNFKVLSKEENNIVFDFYSNKIKLKITFYVENNLFKMRFSCPNLEINRFWIRLQADPTEAIYGCGEQFSEVNFRGKDVPLWVEEQGVGRGDPPITGDWYTTYHPQPTFVSSQNYFCHCESTSYARFDFKDKDFHELHIWSVPEEITIGKYGNTLETVSNLTLLLGVQPELPDWAYDGVWLGIQGGMDVVEKKIQTCLEKKVKIAAVWCQDWQGIHMQGAQKRLIWNWEYDEDLYPDLPTYIKNLNDRGIKYLGYNNSMLAKGEEQYQYALDKGLTVKDINGNQYKIVTDSGEKSMLDLTNSETIHWFKEIIKDKMIGIGLSGWMADYGEYLPIDSVLHSGVSPETFHNEFPVVFAKANYEALKETDTLGKIVFFTRAGYSRVSKYTTLIWAGDQLIDWSLGDGLGTVIPPCISLGICGIGYYHYDIGGFHSLENYVRTKEMFMRWTEASVFTSVMRTHESIKPFDNLQFDYDEETLEHFAKMVDIHVQLKPYLLSLSEEYQKSGISPFRGCFLHYENDPELRELKYQYMLGSDLVIAPVIEPNKDEWKVYLPKDDWTHLWSNKEYKGGWSTVKAPLGKPPIFYRKDSKFKDLFERIAKI